MWPVGYLDCSDGGQSGACRWYRWRWEAVRQAAERAALAEGDYKVVYYPKYEPKKMTSWGLFRTF